MEKKKGLSSKAKFVRGKKTKCCKDCNCGSSCSGAFYGLGFLGAAIYFISTATGFWNGVLGFLKAIVWPVFAVKEFLGMIGA